MAMLSKGRFLGVSLTAASITLNVCGILFAIWWFLWRGVVYDEPIAQNFPPCNVTLIKEARGFVRLSIANLGSKSLVLQRYTNKWDWLRFARPSLRSGWDPVTLPPGSDVDPGEERPADWVALGAGGSVSWQLEHLKTSSIKRGEKIRLTWDPSPSAVPNTLKGCGAQFPSKPMTVDLVVQ